MGMYLDVATALAVVNVVMLVGLLVVWLRNYRTFRSQVTLGLSAFGAVLLLENLVAIYFFAFSMKSFFAMGPTPEFAVMLLRGLEFVALAFLSWVTMQ